MATYYVASERNRSRAPAQGCLVEFEDVLTNCCAARLLAPPPSTPGNGSVDVPPRDRQHDEILIIVAMATGFVGELLRSIPDWRSRFDLVCAYVADAWLAESEKRMPVWRRKLSRHWNALSKIDRYFIPAHGCAREIEEAYRVPVSVIPMACDVLGYGSYGLSRVIDVMGYGRQHPSHAAALARKFNGTDSQRIYYHTDHTTFAGVLDFHAHRRLFWKLLGKSEIALAYDTLAVNTRKFPCSFVGQRWFESIAAGCLIIGRRPTCPEMDELFAWQDSTIEVPEDEHEFLAFVEALLDDPPRLEAAHRRNFEHALERHDWRRRVASIHDVLGLEYPAPLKQNLEMLAARRAAL